MTPLKELRDQSAHLLASVFILLPLTVQPTALNFALAGFCIGTVRELTEESTPVSLRKLHKAVTTSKLDLLFWTLGGVITALIAGLPTY